jgi:hypothetical protein
LAREKIDVSVFTILNIIRKFERTKGFSEDRMMSLAVKRPRRNGHSAGRLSKRPASRSVNKRRISEQWKVEARNKEIQKTLALLALALFSLIFIVIIDAMFQNALENSTLLGVALVGVLGTIVKCMSP